MVAFGVAAVVAIALAVVCFVLRSKGHADGTHNDDYDKVTGDDSHVHVD